MSNHKIVKHSHITSVNPPTTEDKVCVNCTYCDPDKMLCRIKAQSVCINYGCGGFVPAKTVE